MKHLAVALVVFLLMGCQTTNTVPPKDTSPTKEQPKTKVIPKQKAEHQKKMQEMPTVITTSKPLMCGDPQAILKAIINGAKETPLAMWKDAQYGYKVIVFYNKEKRSATVLEYIPGPYACFLSAGTDVHVEGIGSPPKKTGISADRGLTKPLGSAINKVQFVDAD